MAGIQWNSGIPKNIIELSIQDADLFPSYFERGWLIILRGVHVAADLDFLSSIVLPNEVAKGHVKFVLTHPSHAAFDGSRKAYWQIFQNQVFNNDAKSFDKFYEQVHSVNDQLHSIADRVFSDYHFKAKRVYWKFQKILNGENLHIDNIQGCESYAQLRVFANLAKNSRRWSIAQHITAYARRHFAAAGLARHANEPRQFNHNLTAAAFGNSVERCEDPRHYVDFEPGEIWMLNSAMTAHQVRYGTLMALDCLEFPYEDYREPEQALPNVVSRLCREQAGQGTTVSTT